MYTINGIASKIKQSMDAGAIYFEFSDGYNVAYHKDIFETLTDDSGTNVQILKQRIDKLITGPIGRELKRLLYKTSKGWVDFQRVCSIDWNDPYLYAETYYTNFKVDNHKLKSVQYFDATNYGHQIDAFDGEEYDKTSVIQHNRLDPAFMQIETCNMDNLNETRLHHMDDLKITLLKEGFNHDNLLIWLNGVFVPYQKDNQSDQILYIENGRLYVNTIVKDYEGTDTIPYRENSFEATIDPPNTKQVWRYNFDLQIYKWDDVGITAWNTPDTVTGENLSFHDEVLNMDRSIRYLSELTFVYPVEENAHILILNGVVMPPNYYHIDPTNNKRIILDGAREAVKKLLADLVAQNIPDPGMKVKSMVPNSSQYSMINFSSLDDTKDLVLNRSISALVNTPSPYSIIFRELNIDDLVLIDGLHERFYYEKDKCVDVPLMCYTARFNDYNTLKSSRVERLYFGFKNK